MHNCFGVVGPMGGREGGTTHSRSVAGGILGLGANIRGAIWWRGSAQGHCEGPRRSGNVSPPGPGLSPGG